MTNENAVRKLVAYNDLDIPLRAMHGRIDSRHRTLAREVGKLTDFYADFGNASADVVYKNLKVAREMRDAVDQFSEMFPASGRQLNRIIEKTRAMRETHLVYGLGEGDSLSSDDYLDVMEEIGLTPQQAVRLYPTLIEVSDSLREERETRGKVDYQTRRVLIG